MPYYKSRLENFAEIAEFININNISLIDNNPVLINKFREFITPITEDLLKFLNVNNFIIYGGWIANYPTGTSTPLHHHGNGTDAEVCDYVLPIVLETSGHSGPLLYKEFDEVETILLNTGDVMLISNRNGVLHGLDKAKGDFKAFVLRINLPT